MKTLTTSFLFVISVMFSSLIYADIYDYEFTPPINTDSEGYAHYKLYIPETVDTIKGIYCYVPGWQGSSLNIVNDVSYQEYVKKHGFGLMGVQMLGSYTDYYAGVSLWSGEAMVSALKELSISSGHPELEFSTLLFDGHSAGGQFSYHFTQWKPERVIAFVTIKGGYHSLTPAGNAIHVPGYMFIGEKDETHRIINLTTIFENNRPNGALWSLATEPNAYHDRVPKEIILSYFDEIIPLRIPATIPYDKIPELKMIKKEDGWLGNRITYDVAAYSEFTGDIGKACWFPNQKIAQEWQDFVHNNSNAISPNQNNVLKIFPNPAKDFINITYLNKNPETIHYIITSVSGQTINEGKTQTNSIDIMTLRKGIYSLSLKTPDIRYNAQIIIE